MTQLDSKQSTPRAGSTSKSSSSLIGRIGLSGLTTKGFMKKMKVLALIASVMLLMLAGCSKYEATNIDPSITPEPSSAPTPVPVETEPPVVYRAPLTGLPAEEAIANRPVLITVENSPQARPQSGLDKADIIYEVLAEGEITRFLAIYQSQNAETIGPVRSMRPYFVEIGDGLDAVLVHAGWSPDAMVKMKEKKSEHLDQVYGDDAFYWRSKERKAPHNLYTSTAKINEGIEKRKFRQDWNERSLPFVESEAALFLEQSGKSVEIPYLHGYSVSYEYDMESKLYKRTMAGKPHVDKETEQQLTAKNIMIIETQHKVLDNEGRRAVDVFGPGQGYLLQEGRAQSITWERKNGLIRAYANGREVPLISGVTWVQIVPNLSKVNIE